MALFDTTWYCNAGDQATTGHYAVAKRPQNTAVVVGQIVRQFTAPAVNNERVFVCSQAGTTANTTDASWTLTRASATTDGTAKWIEATGQPALNGDVVNTISWTQAKAVIGALVNAGQIIKRNNGVSYQLCITQLVMAASEPAFSDVVGTTTAEGAGVWVCLGPVGNFTAGGAPHARLANACASTWFAAGNTVYVGDNHAESQTTAISITPASVNTMARILCHNHSGSYPPASGNLMTGATISTTAGATITFAPTNTSPFYVYGLAFKSGVGTSALAYLIISGPAVSSIYFDNCLFQVASTNSGAFMQVGTATGLSMFWNNCTVSFGHTAHYIDMEVLSFTWQNTGAVLAGGSSVPANFIGTQTSGRFANVVLEGLDLSQLTGSLFNASFNLFGTLLIKDCKLNAAATVATPTATGMTVQLVRCDSAATAYKSARYQYEGTETTETSIVRSGGATDPASQAQSRKIVTTANAQWLRPFKAEPYATWNAVTGSNIVVTVCGAANAGALPNNDDIFMEVQYLGSSSSLGTIVTTTKSNLLATSAAVASDGSTWATPHTTLDGASTVTMSNGNLTATHGSATSNVGVTSTADLSGGKYYLEFTISGNNDSASLGLLIPGTSFSTFSGGTNCVGCGSLGTNTFVHSNNTTWGNIGTAASGDVFCIAVDLTARLAWVRRNNGSWNANGSANPVTGVGGATVAAGSFAPVVRFSSLSATTAAITVNFGQTAFAFTQPSGFLSWDTGWTFFKLVTTLTSPQPGLAGYIHARVRAAKASTTYYIDPMVTLS